MLLAEPPGKRNDDAEPKKRGPYKSRKIKYYKGGRRKNQKTQAFGGEIKGSTARTTFPGYEGSDSLKNLGKGIYETYSNGQGKSYEHKDIQL